MKRLDKRTCTRCGEVKEREDFHRSPTGAPFSHCRDCHIPVDQLPLVRTDRGPDGLTWSRYVKVLSHYLEMKSIFEETGRTAYSLWGVEIDFLDLTANVNSLPVRQREVIAYLLCGYNVIETADTLGEYPHVVQERRRRGVKALMRSQGFDTAKRGVGRGKK
jgi:hypothetical protein